MNMLEPNALRTHSSVTVSAVTIPQPAVLQRWQELHQSLSDAYKAGDTASLASYAIYSQCVSQVFGQEQDAAFAQHLFSQLTEQLRLSAASDWPSQQLDKACALAWLQARLPHGLVTAAPVLLTELDHALAGEARRLLQQPGAASRPNFLRALRYFSLRLPTPAASQQLQHLLSQQVEASAATSPAEQLPLGLASGLAAEMLLLIKLSKAGIRSELLNHRIQAGVLLLLSVKRDVDFLEQRYSVFPYQMPAHARCATFSAELSWSHGDVGQALMLYEAQDLLQDAELAKIAELVGLNTLLRTTTPATGIVSSYFYEGAAGVAHLYRKLHVLSGQPAYWRGYQFWLDQTQYWLGQELTADSPPHRGTELVAGLAGVGLVLLTALSTAELDWDAVLL